MTKPVFLQLCEDAGLVDEKACTREFLFYLYRRVQGTQVPFIDQDGFESALLYIAKKRGTSAMKIYAQVYQTNVTRQKTLAKQGKLTMNGMQRVFFTGRPLVP